MYESYIPETIKDMEKLTEEILIAIGYLVESQARLLATVDTGRLRQSIEKAVDLTKQQVHIGSSVEHSIYIEMGTKFMQSQPFLTPAFFNNIERMTKIAKDYYNELNN